MDEETTEELTAIYRHRRDVGVHGNDAIVAAVAILYRASAYSNVVKTELCMSIVLLGTAPAVCEVHIHAYDFFRYPV